MVSQVAHRFGHGAECGRRLDPAHRAGHRYANKLGLSMVFRQDKCKPKAIEGSEEEAVEPVLDVSFSCSHWAKLWVGMSYDGEDSV